MHSGGQLWIAVTSGLASDVHSGGHVWIDVIAERTVFGAPDAVCPGMMPELLQAASANAEAAAIAILRMEARMNTITFNIAGVRVKNLHAVYLRRRLTVKRSLANQITSSQIKNVTRRRATLFLHGVRRQSHQIPQLLVR